MRIACVRGAVLARHVFRIRRSLLLERVKLTSGFALIKQAVFTTGTRGNVVILLYTRSVHGGFKVILSSWKIRESSFRMAVAFVTRNSRLCQRFIRYLPAGKFVDSRGAGPQRENKILPRREREPRFVVHKGVAFIRRRGRTTTYRRGRPRRHGTVMMAVQGNVLRALIAMTYFAYTEEENCIPSNDTGLTEQCNDAGCIASGAAAGGSQRRYTAREKAFRACLVPSCVHCADTT